MNQLDQRQRVKITAALTMIHDHGFDANTVIAWAKQYRKQGSDMRDAYEKALNDFMQGQPDLAEPLMKVTRLVQASNEETVAKYDHALNTYVQTGDASGIEALAPMIVQDSVALAARHGEIDGGVNAANVQAALGFEMADQFVQAAQPAAQTFAFNTTQPQAQAQEPAMFTGYVSAKDRAKWADAPVIGAGEPRGLLAGHTLQGGLNTSQA